MDIPIYFESQKFSYLEIIVDLRNKLEALKALNYQQRGEFMDKTIDYMDTFCKLWFHYRQVYQYGNNNTIVECKIRLLACERKNIIFFVSHTMTQALAIYYTILVTCK